MSSTYRNRMVGVMSPIMTMWETQHLCALVHTIISGFPSALAIAAPIAAPCMSPAHTIASNSSSYGYRSCMARFAIWVRLSAISVAVLDLVQADEHGQGGDAEVPADLVGRLELRALLG